MALPDLPHLLDDPATPHARIAIKESKVIRLVQWRGRKRLKVD
jgi:phage baseplate assembly protein W